MNISEKNITCLVYNDRVSNLCLEEQAHGQRNMKVPLQESTHPCTHPLTDRIETI